MLKPAIISLLFCFSCLMLQAQTAELNRKVTLQYRNVQLSDVLADISRTYNIYFAYSNDYIPLEQRISLKVRKKPLSEALDELFEGLPVEYTSIGNQIVLKRSETIGQIEETIPPPLNNDILYGMRGDDVNVEEFTASIEGVELLNPLDRESIPLMARPYEWSEQDQEIFYAPLLEPQFIEKEPFIKAQVSLVPSLGTNGYKSEDKTNNISLNVISGRNGGVDGVEVGIMTNHVKNDVKGVQIAGLVNTVGGNVGESEHTNDNGKRTPGVQAAGLVNVANNVNAVQIGGLVNVTKGHFDGVQFAGLVNTVGEDIGSNRLDSVSSSFRAGVQIAGLVNTGGNTNAVQIAGLVNVSRGKFKGVQVAGIGNNVNRDGEGVQVGGIYNVNRGNGQTQIATITNTADDIQGSQVSLFFNKANRVSGVQIGLINVCDTTSGGSIGLINIVKRGYNRIEIAGSLTLGAHGALKLGSHKFYNIFQGSRQFSSKTWSLGYGIGTAIITGKKTLINLELITSHVNEEDSWTSDLNLLSQFRTSVEVRIGKRFSFFAGPDFNIMFSDLYDPDTGEYGSSIVPYTMYVNENPRPNETHISMWIGFNAGMRF